MPKATESKNDVDAQSFSEMKKLLEQISAAQTAMQLQLQEQQKVISRLPTAVKIEPKSSDSTASPAKTATTPKSSSLRKKLVATLKKLPPLSPGPTGGASQNSPVSANAAPKVSKVSPAGLIQPEQSKQAVEHASKAVIKLLDSGLNGEEWKARFLDYLEAMGLKRALQATRMTQVDVDNKKEREVQNKALVDQLRRDEKSKARWGTVHTRLKGSLDTATYTQLHVNPMKDVSRNEDFFDLWDRCLRKIGETREYTNLASKRNELHELKLGIGGTISGLMSTVEGLANDINALAGTTRIPEEDRGWYFYHAIEKSPFQKEFEHVLERVRPKVASMPWRTLTEKFLAAAPKDAKGMEIPMAQQTTEEKKGELAMNAQERRGDQQVRRQGNQQNRPQRDQQGTPRPQGSRDCRDWTNKGSCSWQQKTGRECKFVHDPQKRGRGRPGNGNTAETIRNLANLIEIVRAQRTQVSAQQQQAQPQQSQLQQPAAAPTPTVRQPQQVQTGVAGHAGTDLDELDGILRLVEGLPDGWAGSVTENPYGNLPVLVNSDDEDSDDEDDKQEEDEPEGHGDDLNEHSEERKGMCWYLWGFMVTFLSVMVMPVVVPVKALGRCCHQKRSSRSTRRKKARKARERQLKLVEAVAMGVTDVSTEHEALLDSGCSKSATPLKGLLTRIRDTLVRMFTANGGCSLAKEEGLADIEGVKVRALFIPEFRKTLISLGELDRMGITWKGGNGEWNLYKPDGSFWTTLRRGNDNLYRFTGVARKA